MRKHKRHNEIIEWCESMSDNHNSIQVDSGTFVGDMGFTIQSVKNQIINTTSERIYRTSIYFLGKLKKKIDGEKDCPKKNQ